MILEKNPNRIGDQGESCSQFILQSIAFVNKYSSDIGLDFFCELRENPAIDFFVQVKCTENPKLDQNYIETPYAIQIEKIEEYWIKKMYPVYILITDLTNPSKVYYLVINQDTLNNPEYIIYREKRKKIIFRVPLKNSIEFNNVNDRFILDVKSNQQFSLNDDIIDETDTELIEIMRGTNQSMQVEVKKLIMQDVSKYKSKTKFKNSLKEVFINSGDRINQIHIVDIFIALEYREMIPELIMQVERNRNLSEYKRNRSMNHTYISFLFNGLVKLRAPSSIYKDIKHFLNYNDISIQRGVVRTIGDLNLYEGIEYLFKNLKSPNTDLRYEVYTALSKFKGPITNSTITKIIRNSKNKFEVSASIQCCILKNLKGISTSDIVLQHRASDYALVRQSVTDYLGHFSFPSKMKYLKSLLFDSVHEVRIKALLAINNAQSVEKHDIESLAISNFKTNQDLLFKADMITVLYYFATSDSINFIKDVIKTDRHEIKYTFSSINGNPSMAPIDLGGNSVRILVKLIGADSIPFLCNCLKMSSAVQYKLKIINSFSHLNDKTCIPTLEEIVNYPDRSVSTWAKNSIDKISNSPNDN